MNRVLVIVVTLVLLPSHTGHANSRSGVFAADPDCDGAAG